MNKNAIRWAVAIYMLIFLVGVTWPGAALINQVKPIILGLPFNLFAIAVLITGALALLALLYNSEKDREAE